MAEKFDYMIREDSPSHYTLTKWGGGERPVCEYKVTIRGKDAHDASCDCPAYGKCKHPGIVQKWIQLGKPEGHIIEAEYRKKLLKLLWWLRGLITNR